MECVQSKRVKNLNTHDIHMFCFVCLFVLIWGEHTIFEYVVQIFRRLPLIGALYRGAIPFFMGILILLSAPYLLRVVRLVDIIFYCSCIIFVCVSIVALPENAPHIEKDMWRVLGIAIPMYFIGLGYDHDKFKNVLYYCSILGVFLTFLYQIYYLNSGRELISDNMDAAYNLLPSLLYIFYWAFEKRKIVYWVIAVISLPIIFTFGTRGPLLICLIFVLGGILFKLIWSKAVFTKIFVTTVALLLSLLLFYGDNLIKIIEWLSCLVENLGMSTRIFDLLLEGEIANSTGRDRLAEKVITAILNRPILGYGIMGDWVITGHIYVHNIFLEMWCQFGLILGTFILAVVIVLPLYVMFKYLWKKDDFLFMFMLFCMVFVKLMLSGTYLTETYFFLLLGLSVRYFRRNRRGAVRSVEQCV